MTTSSTALLSSEQNFSDDAGFRAWGKPISDAMTAVGLAQTADTGQINWTTASKPGVLSTYAGYEIRAMSDTLDATKPLRLKIEYGLSSGSYTRAGIRLTIGTGSDGAGNITGNATTATVVLNHSGTASGGPGTLAACRIDGTFWIAMSGMTNALWMLCVERRKVQASGAVHSSGDFQWSYANGTTAPTYESRSYAPFLPRTATSATDAANLVWASLGSGLSGGNITVARHYGCFPAIESMDSHVFYRAGELGAGDTFSTTVLTSRTYRATGYTLESAANAYFAGVWE